jgi:hypothetical protein
LKKNSQSEYTKLFIDHCIADGERRLNQSVGKSDAGFHIESSHFDAQNRAPWNDKDTNWKDKR